MAGDAEGRDALMEMIGEVVGLLDIEEFRPGVLEAVRRTIPCRWASLNEVGPDRVFAVVHPHLDAIWYERFALYAHENPLYRHWVRTRDGRAYRFSDVCTREELESTRLYQEVYRQIGVEHQVSVTLPNGADAVLAIVLHRGDRDFTDAECELLDRARPFLIQAYRNALAYSGLPANPGALLSSALARNGLTRREAEVVALVALGASNRDIATDLAVSERTVHKHLQHSFRKLEVPSRSAAAAVAWEMAQRTGPQLMP